MQLVKYAIVFVFGSLIVITSIQYWSPDFSSGYLLGKEELFNGIFKYALYAHILSAPVCLFLGIFLITEHSIFQSIKVHRIAGYIYALTLFLLAAPSGFVLAIYAEGGILGKLAFILLSVLWIVFTLKAIYSIRHHRLSVHKHFMSLSYALTISAILLRILLFASNYWFPDYSKSRYALIAWLSLLLPIGSVELYRLIRKKI